MNDVSDRKAELRGTVKARRAVLTDRVARSAAITGHLTGLSELLVSKSLLLYRALPQEVDIDELFEWAYRRGTTVASPICRGGELVPVVWQPGDVLVTGRFGVREPTPDIAAEPARQLLAGELDAVVLPGVAFDLQGNRLGQGKAFYDRLLPSLPVGAVRIGVAFGVQLVDALPIEPSDAPVDCIVTEDGPRWTGARVRSGAFGKP